MMSWHEPDSRYHVPIKRREVDIYFTDGTHVTDVLNMILQDGTERVIDRVEIDGETLSKERTCEIKELDALTQTLSMANCYAWGECSACGYITPADSCYCVNCGAKVTNG